MKKHVICLFIFLYILLLANSCIVNPVTGQKEFNFISTKDEIRLGKKYGKEIEKGYGLCTHEGINQYVRSVGEKLVSVVHRKDLSYSFTVVNTVDINAFVIPGGKVFIYRGLLERINNEAQLAAVLGHELGHAAAMHIGKKISKYQAFNLLVTLGSVGIDVATKGKNKEKMKIVHQLGSGGLLLLFQKYNRTDEEEADRLGMLYEGLSGWNPKGMIQLLTVLKNLRKKEPSSLEIIFSDHPAPTQRIKLANQEIERLIQNNTFPNQQWKLGATTFRRRVLEPLKHLPYTDPGVYGVALFNRTDSKGKPVSDPVEYFTKFDQESSVLIALKNLRNKHKINIDWITPRNKIYFSETRDVKVNNYSQVSLMSIRKGFPGVVARNNLMGNWKLRISIDGKQKGVYTISFK